MTTFTDRFTAKVTPEPTTGCSLWTGASTRGYGRVRRDGRLHRAHRVAYELFVGPIPGGMNVLHRCDTPACVNPDHLFLGTPADRVRNRDEKGRAAKQAGGLNGNARLTEDDVRAIRARCAASETQASLAREYSVSKTTISLIARRVTWKHVRGAS